MREIQIEKSGRESRNLASVPAAAAAAGGATFGEPPYCINWKTETQSPGSPPPRAKHVGQNLILGREDGWDNLLYWS